LRKHKKKISILTLTVFILLTIFSGAGTALAAKTPADKTSVEKPTSMNSDSGGGGANFLGDQSISNVNTNSPHLDDLKVIWGSGYYDYEDLISRYNSGECFATTHSTTVPASADTVDVTFDPDRNNWSEWWLGSAVPPEGQRHREQGSEARTISDVALQDGDNIVTIRVGNRQGQQDRDVLTVTLTITKPCVDIPHLDSLLVDGQELITDSGKKTATSHSITVSENLDDTDVVFLPHNADWSEWWLGPVTSVPSTETQRHRVWNSSNRTISDIELQDGDNIITIRVGDYTGWPLYTDHHVLTVTLTITKPASAIPVNGVSLNKSTLDLAVGGNYTLQATIDPSDATNQNVTWSANPAGVVTLTGSGLTRTVTAGSMSGTTTVTVTTEDGSKTATCAVTVWDLSLDKTTLEMTAGGNSRTIIATTAPGSKTVTWSSSNEDVATVNGGVVTPVAAGTADITASIDVDGTTLSRTCTVNVKKPLYLFIVGEPTLNPDGTYEATFGYTSYYTGVTTPSLLTKNELTNATASPSLPVAFGPGTNNNAFTTTYLHSKPAVWTVVYDGVTSKVTAGVESDPQVDLDKATLDLVVNGSSKDITATISRPLSLFMTQGVTSDIAWSIESGSQYIEIDGSGRTCTVTPKAQAGTAVVKATFADGNSATCTVKVWDLYLSPTTLEMTAGGNSRTITATTAPGSKTVTWSSSNEDVATVNGGVVTPVAAGTADITASIDVDGTTLSRTCTVNVYEFDLTLQGDPVLQTDGTYLATFGYTKTFPHDITLVSSSLNRPETVYSGSVPTEFTKSSDYPFTVKYAHGLTNPTWTVTYDGRTKSVTAGSLPNSNVGMSLNLDSALLAPGACTTLTATVFDNRYVRNISGGDASPITWTVNQAGTIISYDDDGRNCEITGLQPGTATVTATCGTASASCNVEVTGINLLPASQDMTKGGNKKELTVSLADPTAVGAAGVEYEWWSDHTGIASIFSINGTTDVATIAPEDTGSTKIWVRVKNSNTTASCSINVYEFQLIKANSTALIKDGTYKTWFYYTSTFPDTITLDSSSVSRPETVSAGSVPAQFDNGADVYAFEVTWAQGLSRPVWTASYDGCTKSVEPWFVDEAGIRLDNSSITIVPGESRVITATAMPKSWFGAQTNAGGDPSPIVWSVQQDGEYIEYDGAGRYFTVTGLKPGTATVTATCDTASASCTVEVYDPRTISVDPVKMRITRGRTGTIEATVYGDWEESNNIPLSEGFYKEIRWYSDNPDVVEVPAGTEGKTCTFQAKKRGVANIYAYLYDGLPLTEAVFNLDNGDSVEYGKYAVCEVTVRNPKRDEPEPAPAPAALPEIPLPPAMETLDVTITIGSTLAIVNGEEVTLAGNPLLLGADRAMVDYADMALLIPGLEVTWDWKTLSVTFSKDGQELTMVLDEIPAGFDVPFMNIGGRLVVPVRHVGSFFGATVDWIGDTLVVHMYK